MKLNDFRPELTSENINNLISEKFGVKLDISKMKLPEASKILLGLKESLEKNKRSSKAQTSHQNAAYMQKLLVVEMLERYIAENDVEDPFLLHSKSKKKKLSESKKVTKKITEQPVPPAINYFLNRMVEAEAISTAKHHIIGGQEINALRVLVGTENYINAKRAIEYAKNRKPIPPQFLAGFEPILDMLEHIMQGGMTFVRIFKMLDKRARNQLGIEEGTKGTEKALRALYEGTAEEAEVVLAAKDMVDDIQDMVADLGELQNEKLNPLGDKIRSVFGDAQADGFLSSAGQSITSALAAMTQARSEMDHTSRTLSGGGDDMMMGGEVEEPGMEGPMEPDLAMSPPDSDEFGASDAAVGGHLDVGRDRRETIERKVKNQILETQNTILRFTGKRIPVKKKSEVVFEHFLNSPQGIKLQQLTEKVKRITSKRSLKISEKKLIKKAFVNARKTLSELV